MEIKHCTVGVHGNEKGSAYIIVCVVVDSHI